jgi:hypothetical protein
LQRTRVLPLVFAVLAAATPAVFAASLPTNLDMITATVEEAVEQSLAAMETPDTTAWGGSLLVVPQAKHDGNWLVAHILAERLLARGFEVSLDSTKAQPGRARLSYRILDLGIKGKAGLVGSRFERQSHVTLALRLSQADGQTLYWQDEKTAYQSDRAPKDKLEFLQASSFEFAKTDLEEQTWGKFVEPVIISTVLGGMIYLFFSNR